MKPLFLSLALSTAALSSALAQTPVSTTPKTTLQEAAPTRSFRVGLVRPILDAKVEASSKYGSSNDTTPLSSTTGLSVGYASLPVRSLGWTTSAAFMEIVENSASAQLVRADGNLAYAFNPVVSLKGGLNVSKFTKTEQLAKLDPNVGAQAALGLQLGRHFAVDVGYTVMRQSGNISFNDGADNLKVDYQLQGLEIGLNGTF